MAKYEFMLIMDPKLADAERTEKMDELKKLFETNSVKIEKEDSWGEKKLSYKINKSETGFYTLFNLELDGKAIKEMTKTLNLELSIWRFMFVKIEA